LESVECWWYPRARVHSCDLCRPFFTNSVCCEDARASSSVSDAAGYVMNQRDTRFSFQRSNNSSVFLHQWEIDMYSLLWRKFSSSRLPTQFIYRFKNAAFWDVTPCGSCKTDVSDERYHLHHQGEKIQLGRNNVSSN
jgi:hypothetical protein